MPLALAHGDWGVVKVKSKNPEWIFFKKQPMIVLPGWNLAFTFSGGNIMTRLIAAILLGLGLNSVGFGVLANDIVPPPASDSWIVQSQFLACKGNAYALCYYSGPEEPTPRRANMQVDALPCVVDPNDPDAANCKCYAVTPPERSPVNPLGVFLQYNYVLMTGILNEDVFEQTQKECGRFGGDCLNLINLESCASRGYSGGHCAQASVCSMLGDIETGARQSLYPDQPDVALISTFSFEHIGEHDFGVTPCKSGRYAGCMTAPCKAGENGYTNCECPIVDNKYQVGQNPDRLSELGLGCDISPNVWSAANNIPTLPE